MSAGYDVVVDVDEEGDVSPPLSWTTRSTNLWSSLDTLIFKKTLSFTPRTSTAMLPQSLENFLVPLQGFLRLLQHPAVAPPRDSSGPCPSTRNSSMSTRAPFLRDAGPRFIRVPTSSMC